MSELALTELPLRADLRGLQPYGAPQLDVPVRLNTNENPHPPPESLVADMAAAVADAARGLNRYPDREATALRWDLARYLGHGLGAGQVWAANGSNEVLQQVCQAFGGPGRVALGFEPSYTMHRLIARATATGWVGEARRADFTLDPDEAAAVVRRHRPSIVFLCSPNNPTATALRLDVVSAVCDAAPGVVVVDEAYAEFAHTGVPSALALLPRHDRLVVTRTMSKAFALAGARVGYLAADPVIVDALRLVRLPYHLSAVTQVVARAALAHHADLLATVDMVKAERDRIVAELRARGLAVADSDANFVLFDGFTDQRAVWQGLLDHGVLVRDVGLAGWLRVTAGLPAEVDAFLDALDAVLAGAAPAGAAPVSRSARVERRTRETDVVVELDLDGQGVGDSQTGVPFFDHMVSTLGKHAGFDLRVRTHGDLHVDAHHSVEDTAIALGMALRDALGDKTGIRRFGDALVPLDEALVQAAVDLSGRPYCVHEEPALVALIGTYDTTLTRHVFESFTSAAQVALHVRVLSGRNAHHVVEAEFKAVARALRDAVALDPRQPGIPSTKGVL